ncbi:MAG TPA: cytochrome d ubiquinol oxidase subunit II [Blastocatellia bacterium]|nr:cytochrome d ubiquinol oxidase subunit II [Blastocatellia bacterium]
METLWFVLVAFMLTAYVVLDGFDLGAGAIHYVVGRTSQERRSVLRAIGPVWDGNEVWLLAAGGALYFAFPVVYSSSFSGFYLPLMMVLWLIMLRGLGVELRAHIDNDLWRTAWDVVFSGASVLLAIFLGAALGNVVRGVPLDASGYFFEPLWTTFRPEANAGILDWYTVLAGVVALVTLATHGANYVAVKTDGAVNERCRHIAKFGAMTLVVLTAASLAATVFVRPTILDNFRAHAWGAVFPLAAVVSLGAMILFRIRVNDVNAFVASAGYIISMLGGAAFALFPVLLPASTSAEYDLTIHNSATGPYAMSVGIVWWTIGMTLAACYFVFLYRSFRGKVTLDGEGY